MLREYPGVPPDYPVGFSGSIPGASQEWVPRDHPGEEYRFGAWWALWCECCVSTLLNTPVRKAHSLLNGSVEASDAIGESLLRLFRSSA